MFSLMAESGNNNKKSWKSRNLMLPELIVTLIGTVIGILLTVGVTYISEKKDKEEMARKALMLTIHNLDVSTRSMDKLIDEMSRQDSIFNYVRERRFSGTAIAPDTLRMFVSALYSHQVRPIDTSTEDIFSTNFEIWRYIDDPKVIGRIANCYSIMKTCGEEYDRIENEKFDAFVSYNDRQPVSAQQFDEETVYGLLNQSRVIRVMDELPLEIALMRQLVDNAKELNDRNKTQLKIEQSELDEIGRLL